MEILLKKSVFKKVLLHDGEDYSKMRSIGKIDILPLKDYMLPFIMTITLIMNGGFFDDSVALTGILIVIVLFAMLVRGESFCKRDKRIVFVIPYLILGISVLVSIWSIDYMENLMGVMRLGVLCLWMYLIRCRNKKEILLTQKSIPVMGSIMVLLACFSLCIPSMSPYFWENKRLSGFFQYANTSAFFLTVGIIILIHHWKEQKKKFFSIIQMVSLVAGILLTGSRSVLIFLMVWGIYYAVITKKFRKPFIITVSILTFLIGLFVAFTGNTQNVGRIFSSFTSNSTLWGRLLYNRDAILLLAKKFYGLGRLGYYYSQGTFQSGVYHTKFVHNDFLQLALDYGIITLILLLIFLGWQFYRGRQDRKDKEILFLICAMAMVDFHCQYSVVLMLTALFLDYGECVKEKRAQIRENYIIFPILLVMLIYIGIATGSSRKGNQELALSMLPDYTDAQEKKMVSCMGTLESYQLSTELIKKNPYNITAYITRGTFYYSNFCVSECIEDFDRMLELDPYNVTYYAQYEELLKNMLIQMEKTSGQWNDSETEEQYQKLLEERMESLPEQLEAMSERTSSLAYKIKDKPIFVY